MNYPLLVFVHGLGGEPQTTWGGFDQLIADDNELGGREAWFYGYPTPWIWVPFIGKKPLSVQELAKGLITELDCRYGADQKIILICHSLGGLIGRQLIVDELERMGRTRVVGMLQYATPNTGSDLSHVSDYLPWKHVQLRQLCRRSDFIKGLNDAWKRLNSNDHVRVRCVVAGQDRVVDSDSAIGLYGEGNICQINNYGHVAICKPNALDDIRYLAFKRFVQDFSYDHSGCIGSYSGSPLFDYYTPAQEAFYVNRKIDLNLRALFEGGSIWLSGRSGLGKTAALKRLLDQSSSPYAYVMMAAYAGSTSTEVIARGLYVELCDQAKVPVVMGSHADLAAHINSIVDLLSRQATERNFHLFIEEIPVAADGAFLHAFVDVIYALMLNSLKSGLADRIKFVLSSIENPAPFIKAHMQKMSERFQFSIAEDWNEDELRTLVRLVCGALDIHISPNDEEKLIRDAKGSPRFIKKVLRTLISVDVNGKILDDILFSVSKELA